MNEEKGMRNVVSIGAALKPAIDIFAKMEIEAKEFSKALKTKLEEIHPRYCAEHDETEIPVDFEQTFARSFKATKLKVIYGQCPECQGERDRILVNEKSRKLGVPEKVIEATFGNYITDTPEKKKVLAKVKQHCELNTPFIILRGTPGTGKTHLATACLKEKGGLFITQGDLIAKLRQTYTDNTGPEAFTEPFREAECFVLDEMDVNVKGSDIAPLLYRILAHRYDKGLQTVLTSNEKFTDILDILGPRLTDRIKANYIAIPMEWESHRSAK